MANVKLLDHPGKLIPRLASAYGRRRFGRDTEPVQAAAHHSGVLVADGLLETAAQMGWKKLDHHLALLACQATAGAIGCSWCTDFGYYESLQHGQEPAKVRDVATWRESDVYSDQERAVLEYAEGATSTPATVSDDLVARLHEHFSDAEMVELASWVLPQQIQRGAGAQERGLLRQLPGAGISVSPGGLDRAR